MNNSSVFVLVTDHSYLYKAEVTIRDLRTAGKWAGDIIVISLDNLTLTTEFKRLHNVDEVKFPSIDKTHLLKQIGTDGFPNSDKRELTKLNQWEKFHVFDEYFLRWNRVVYLDAGLRVLDNVHTHLLSLDCAGKLLAPVDGTQTYERPHDIFRHQLDHTKPDRIQQLLSDFGENILESRHMLNCMWMYDTNLLHRCNKQELIDAMNKYPVCRTNEMGIMNLIFHFQLGVWVRLPAFSPTGKLLFDWCELNSPVPTTWQQYCFLKYPVTIRLNQPCL